MIESVAFPQKKSDYLGPFGRRGKESPGPYSFILDIKSVRGKTFRFKPGLNILVGPNGTGKSTVLRACALSLAAIQGGVSAVTESWLRDLFSFPGEAIMFPWSVVHDGRPILFCDPRETIGITGGAFDNDFFKSGVVSALSRGSTGELSLRRISGCIKAVKGEMEMPSEIEWRMEKSDHHDVWNGRLERAGEYLAANIPLGGPQTILLDEPESCLSIPLQARLWSLFNDADYFKNLQVVVATHSPFAFGIAHANYIELERGYLDECQSSIACLRERPTTHDQLMTQLI
jgi:energy-coupling factor transporter ATP-binding protein EcfA2